MKNAILYITPLPSAASLAALPNLAERALHQNTPIYVWLVASASAPTSSPELFKATRGSGASERRRTFPLLGN